jgi:hypothetical protein
VLPPTTAGVSEMFTTVADRGDQWQGNFGHKGGPSEGTSNS